MSSATPAGFRFVHLTDTHVMAGGRWKPRSGEFEWDTEASLRRVVAAIRRLDPAPAFAVLGGDLASPDLIDRERVLTSEEYEPSYRLLGEILADLPCPAHFLMGNHDDRAAFHRVLGGPGPAPDGQTPRSFDHDGHHFVALDSLERGRDDGVLHPAQLAWLEDDLGRHRGRPTLVFVHHHPWPLGLAWMDSMRLRNGEVLMACLERHPQVAWVICGHVHTDQSVQRGRLTMLTTPSTCLQLSKTSQAAKMFPGPPAFRVVDVAGEVLSTRILHLRDDRPDEL